MKLPRLPEHVRRALKLPGSRSFTQRHGLRRRIALVGALLLSCCLPHAVFAQDTTAACLALKNATNRARFATLVDAPTTLLTVRVVPQGGDGTLPEKDFPEFCEVEAQIAPTIGVFLRMPTSTWNGKLLMGGCGGPCGNFPFGRYDTALVRNYAVVVTDMGHQGQGWAWAYQNIENQIDFGFRSTHVTAIAAKDVVDAFYGSRAKRNYFWGCSTGGRQGLVESQRFPKDFDGIVAGAAPYSQTGFQAYVYGWQERNNVDPEGKPILTAAKLPVVHKAVMAACDKQDGIADNLLQNPLQCKWDPKQIQCKAGVQGEECLTAAQVDVVRKFYDGPRNSRGEVLFHGRARGSEMTWKPGVPSKLPNENLMTNYLSFFYPPGPNYHRADFDLDRDPERLALKDWLFNMVNPDLRPFKAAGGKMILFHGWDDNNDIPPEQAIDYYELTTRTMGGDKTTKDFFRMFLPPGMFHCQYGPGGGEIDWLTAIENWVEKGQAPDQVIAYHMKKEPYDVELPPGSKERKRALYPRHPLDPSTYDRSRPVYAYPDVARYSGKGNPNEPGSWEKEPRK